MPLDLRTRKFLLCGLLCAFLIQSSLVYWDDTGLKTPPLSTSAKKGQDIWLSHNCQSCHQIYGFGGFLGPDLTNAIKRLTDSRIEFILQYGSAQMPAYHFNISEREALLSFFKELDKTGKSWPSIDKDKNTDPIEHFYISSKTMLEENADAKRGFELVQTYSCISCHLPNTKSVHQAPDLTLLMKRLSKDEISKILVDGRIERGMPPFHIPETDRESVIAFLNLLSNKRDEFLNIYRGSDRRLSLLDFFKRLPWFEYE